MAAAGDAVELMRLLLISLRSKIIIFFFCQGDSLNWLLAGIVNKTCLERIPIQHANAPKNSYPSC